MNPSQKSIKSVMRRFFNVDERSVDATMSVVHRDEVLDLTARVGMIDGIRCVIEERGPGLYLLHGYLPGTWDIEGVETTIDDEGDAQVAVQRWRVLPLPGELSVTDERIHVIVGMNTPQQADEFFGDHLQMVWRAKKPENLQPLKIRVPSVG